MADDVCGAMAAEAERAFPDETGGVLLGYWLKDGKQVIVTQMVGPGPNSVHRRTSFVPDTDYHEREIARLYEEAGRLITYLGDWHTHPLGRAYLSKRDRRTLRGIATHDDARAPQPIMAILAGGSPWKLRIWAFKQPKILKAIRSQRIVPLRVITF